MNKKGSAANHYLEGPGARPKLTELKAILARGETLKVSAVGMAWRSRPRLVDYPTGVRGWRAEVLVTVSGFRPTAFTVTSDARRTWLTKA